MGLGTTAVGSCSGREIGLNSQYKWEFIAKEQVGANGLKLLRGNLRGKGDSG